MADQETDLAYANGYYAGFGHGRQAQAQLTIGEIIERGWVECPECKASRSVGSEGNARGMVSDCVNCGDSGYWNLFVEFV